MTYLCDMHMHSKASDGQYKPSELVHKAKDLGLQLIALTDHDSISGIAEAQEEGQKLGLIVLPGVEMSAKDYHTFHILGYCFDPDILSQNKLFNGLPDGRAARSIRILNYLKSKGVDIQYQEVLDLAGDGVIGRPHFARVMLKHGICEKWEDVFNIYLDTDEYHAVVEDKPSAEAIMDALTEAGAMISLAHPYQTGLDDEELEKLIVRMKDMGLRGIECYHSGHTPAMIQEYLYLAQKYDLIVTGGSDFHGEQVKADRPMAKLSLDFSWLREFNPS